MEKAIVILIVFIGLIFIETNAQNKVVLLDISQEVKSEYLKVSPEIFQIYKEHILNSIMVAK